jgi:hypothetical protein
LYREIENLIDLFENAEIFVGKSAAKEVASLITSIAVMHKSRKTVLIRRTK